MIPSPWVALILALGAARIVRLIGWDDLPSIVRVRDWVTGAVVMQTSTPNAGFTPESPMYVQSYRRPMLAHFLACPFCQGFWVSCAVYVAWLLEPTGTVYALAAFALSEFVGLVSKNLDP